MYSRALFELISKFYDKALQNYSILAVTINKRDLSASKKS